MDVDIRVIHGDALSIKCDVLALKYAEAFYGVDLAVANILKAEGLDLEPLVPKPSGFRLVESRGRIVAKAILFVGVGDLRQFDYRQIREFGRKVLASLAGNEPQTRHVCLTVHGPGYGLDETEAFEAEIAGLLDAIRSDDVPPNLSRITITEQNPGRAKRLQQLLKDALPQKRNAPTPRSRAPKERSQQKHLETVGYDSEDKPRIFVAMPFADNLEDTFHYGIEAPVKAAGFLCERADLSTFTGDILAWIKKRIASSHLVIADLTTANPNVYLEVGYAWGCNKPTILLVKDTRELKFDVQSQRCIEYKKITDLEESLKKYLRAPGFYVS